MQFALILLMIVIFWFFIIRPNTKRQKEIQRQREQMKTNDKVILSDGIMGTIKEIKHEQGYAYVQIAENVKVKVSLNNVYPLVEEIKQK